MKTLNGKKEGRNLSAEAGLALYVRSLLWRENDENQMDS